MSFNPNRFTGGLVFLWLLTAPGCSREPSLAGGGSHKIEQISFAVQERGSRHTAASPLTLHVGDRVPLRVIAHWANAFHKPFYLLINFALGGGWGGKIDDTVLPQQFLIKSVHIYQRPL